MKKYYIAGNNIFIETKGENTYCTTFKKDKVSFKFSVEDRVFSLAKEVNEYVYNLIINRRVNKYR